MKQFKRVVTNGFFILVLYLVIILGILVAVEMSPVSAQVRPQPVYTTLQDAQQPAYATLKDAPQPANDISTQRDITKQRFAPLEK